MHAAARPPRLLLRELFALAAVAMLWQAPAISAAAEHPNVVVILTDDQGWGDLSVNGNGNIATPAVDSLARDGASFDRFFVCPVCSPTRAEFLTGRYHARTGVWNVSTGGERLDLDERTIADTFRAAGYATAAFGKWHNGTQYPYHPLGRGFDHYYGFTSGHWGNYFSPLLDQNGELTHGDGYVTDDFTTHAMRFIEEHRDGPFFCYLPYCTPHSPMQVPDRFYEKFQDAQFDQRHRDPEKEDLAMTRAALAMCENIDWNVGRVLSKLDDLEIAENTIVVYFCDNGPNSWRWNGGMRGRKGSTDEGGVRSPLFIRWPAAVPAGVKVPQIASSIDLLPTLAALAKVDIPQDRPLDGIDLSAWVKGRPAEISDRLIFSHWNRKVSLRTQQYRLDNEGRLYDMHADPGQNHDLAAEQPQVAKRLRTAMQQWKDTVLVELDREPRPFTVGYPEFPLTQLPARDGLPHGNVKRSGRAPNCSFFTNWITTDDRITWDVAVHTAGAYTVELLYACPPSDIGATIELGCGDASLSGKLTTPHDPPLRGAENDRADRGSESYVKDFATWKLGTIDLTAGRHNLTLAATDIPGDQVMEVRMVLLRKSE